MASKASPARLIIADSERDPDMLYATRFFAPDAFIFLEHNGRRIAVLNDLEVDRGRAQAQVDEVLSLSDETKRLGLKEAAPLSEFVPAFLRARKIRRAEVPSAFPFGLADVITKTGIQLVPAKGLFWKEREHKSDAELKLMRRALAITEAGMARGVEVLRASKPGKKKNILEWGGKPLTSEILRAEIDAAILREGGPPSHHRQTPERNP